MEIQQKLLTLQDPVFRDFNAKLIPNIEKTRIIGIKTPTLRNMAKEMIKSGEAIAFLQELPHAYFEEDQLHAFLLSEIQEWDSAVGAVEHFLPYINNWATCDQLIVKAFARQPERLLPHIETWLQSEKTYTVRYAIGLLMRHFLDKRFADIYPRRVAAVRSDDYYINMMAAWYFATALAKQPQAIYPYFTEKRLSLGVHNKAIAKARESKRIPADTKAALHALVRRNEENQ